MVGQQQKKRKASSTSGEAGEENSKKKTKAVEDEVSVRESGLSAETIEALESQGKSTLFPIQARVFGLIVEQKKDILARAKTGTGKTLAFCLPILETLRSAREPGALVLAPTRELALQVCSEFAKLAGSKLRSVCVYGGAPYGPQISALRAGVDVVVGTPGRAKDLIDRKVLRVDALKFAVLDEADSMLDMGFEKELEAIFGAAKFEQLLLFSATMPQWVSTAAEKYAKNLEKVEVGDRKSNADIRHLCVPAHWQQVHETVNDVQAQYEGKTLVFCETKVECNEMVEALSCECRALHGDISQKDREKTIAAFRDGKLSVLVATDVAARGLDMSVELVIMNKPPATRTGRADVETYTHRSGRTGRAGQKGVCVTLYGPRQRATLEAIERSLGNFEWVGAPRASDILESRAQKAADAIRATNDDVVPLFEATAQALLKETPDALAKALAALAGYEAAPPARSLLSNTENYVTVVYNTTADRISAVWAALRRKLSPDACDKVKGMRLTAAGGAVFDVPKEAAENSLAGDPAFDTTLDTLPKLKPPPAGAGAAARPSPRGGYGRSYGGRGYGGRGNGGRGRGPRSSPRGRGRSSSSA
ncbi:hypothetical protein CTAYLR_001390 [Chrysophaeum taylorii]|uniref:RNA helicase n=1 Tax=Chrysophaeum taylorii TaxID=2483200 RepID=A0AAD7U5F4_9STRA|nr:hypothetical protein CTAYLR_001390 [Chrysophaeum taylorii]